MNKAEIKEIYSQFAKVLPANLQPDFYEELLAYAKSSQITNSDELITYATGLTLGIHIGRKYCLREIERAAQKLKMEKAAV